MKRCYALSGVMLLAISSAAMAKPVSYAGGWTAMQMNDADMHSVHVNYSPTARYSVGYTAEYWRDEEWQFQGGQFNYLAKRWNNPASQGNLYLQSGAGVAYSDYQRFDHNTEPAGFVGITADWEDRRYFTSYENRATYAGDIDKFFMQKARVGIAPYVGDYGDLHTWLMLQVDHNPGKSDNVTITPLVRLFKGNNLGEAGISNKGHILFNLTLNY
jgi:hypothetical protein